MVSVGKRKIAAPSPHPETEEYWRAAAAGRLLLKRCLACGEPHHYPRAICPFCLSADTTWIEASGRGRIYSYSTMGVAEAAYTLAYVTLEEGVTMLTNIVDCAECELRVGLQVKVVFEPCDGGQPVPMFAPA